MTDTNDESLYAISFEDDEEASPPPLVDEAVEAVVQHRPATSLSPCTDGQHRSSSVSHDTTLNKASHTTLVKSQSFHVPEDALHLSAIKPSNDLIWIQQFDPRTRTFYYINATTGDCTTVKPRFVSKAKARDPSHAAALVIQCAARVRRARLIVKSLRDAPAFHAVNELATATTDASAIMHEAYIRKCRHVNVLLDDLSLAISHRHVIASHNDDAEMVASLAALHAEFKDTWTYIKSTFDATKQVVEDPAALLHLHSEDLNTTLVQVRKACLQLHRTIASHDESFMALDLFRVNQARLQFSKWSVPAAHDDGALHKAHLRVEGQLRKTMGAAGFQSLTGGMAVPPSRSFTEWHGSVVAMLASVAAYEALLEIDASSPSTSGNNTKDTLNIENIGSTQGTLCEAAAVLPSQLQSTSAGDSRVLPKQARRTKMSLDISELRQCWIDGVKLREADLAAAAQAEKDAIHTRAVERQAIQSAQEKFRNDQHKRKLTIWEAVIEGWPVEKINQLAVAEGKKAAQDGAGAFRLRDSQAENGRTLLQLACWSGHVHLVRYFVDKGSNLGQFDCVNNRFSLLHDAARAGRADVVRVLLEYGLPCNILDNYGDNPVHWAARRNHVDTVQALLDLPLKDEATVSPTVISTAQITRWRSVLATNGRGKRPAHLTTLHRLRTILMDFERVAQAGLEQYNRQGASEAAMLKRRDGLGPPPVKRIPLTSGGGSSGGSSRGMVPQRCHADVADSASPPSSSSPSTSGVRTTDPPVVDGRRQREFRVKQATARAVKNFEKEGRKHANVQLAGRVFRHSLQHTSSAFAIKTDDMDIFLDHVVE